MIDLVAAIEAHWPAFAAAALVVLALLWWLVARARKRPRVRGYQPDVLDEGAAPALRNQSLIDAPPAAQIAMPPRAVVGAAVRPEIRAEPASAAQPDRAPEPERLPEPEVIAQPPAIPGLDDAVSSADAANEMQVPDSAAAPTAAPTAAGDDLSRIKGLGPKLQVLLPSLGLRTYAQIAALTQADLAALDPKLGAFAGRPARDGWVEQAQYLAAGDMAGFEGRFGKV